MCPKCIHSGVSKKEKELRRFIRSIYKGKLILNKRTILDNEYEIDIYIPKYKLGIEFNGIYWHSYPKKERKYHQRKFLKAKEKGIDLIQINEYDWETKKDIIKNIIRNRLGLNKYKVFARNVYIKEEIDIKKIKEFLNKNHLHGFRGGSIYLGMYNKKNNNLISMIILQEKKNKKEIELIRYVNKINYSIIGGFSKFIKYIKKNYNYKKIYSFVDINYFSGNGYFKTGWELKKITSPDYNLYYNKNYSWDKITRNKLIKLTKQLKQSQKEIIESKFYYKYYGVGNYLLNINL